jgi:hypothetical protein
MLIFELLKNKRCLGRENNISRFSLIQPSQWSRKTPLYTCIYLLIQSVVATVAAVAKDAFIYLYIFNTECGCNRRSRRNGRERRLYIHVYI